MGVIESFQKYSRENVRLNELSNLMDESYKIVQYSNFYSLKVMEEVINTKWQALFDKLYMSSNYRNVKEYFEKLKEGHINRDQFAEIAKREFVIIDSKIDAVQENVKTSKKNFDTAYDEFFSKRSSESEDLGERLVYHILMQPESKEIIMEFLKL